MLFYLLKYIKFANYIFHVVIEVGNDQIVSTFISIYVKSNVFANDNICMYILFELIQLV